MDVTAIQTMKKSYLRKQKVLELVHLWLPQNQWLPFDLTPGWQPHQSRVVSRAYPHALQQTVLQLKGMAFKQAMAPGA